MTSKTAGFRVTIHWFVLVMVSAAGAGCFQSAPNDGSVFPPDDGMQSPVARDGATEVGQWVGASESGIRCRLLQEAAPARPGETVGLAIEYELLNPARFKALEAELGAGLVFRSGSLQRDGQPSGHDTLDFAVEIQSHGEHVVHAYVWWNEAHGNRMDSCAAFQVAVA